MCLSDPRADRSKINMKFPVERHYFSDSNYHLGIKRVETKFGSYNIHNIERAIYDMVRLKDGAIIEISKLLNVESEYYERIMRYAEMLRCKQKS